MTRSLLLSTLIIGVFISCRNNTSKAKVENINSTHIDISANTDKNFETFITKFSSDSLFQISRIRFPLIVQELELSDSSEMISRTIHISDYRILDFSPPKFKDNIDNYTQKYRIEGTKATIEIRGIDNGIITDFFFEKVNGKWILISWTDSST